MHVVCNLRAGDSLAKMATGKDGCLRPNWSIIMNLCSVIWKHAVLMYTHRNRQCAMCGLQPQATATKSSSLFTNT